MAMSDSSGESENSNDSDSDDFARKVRESAKEYTRIFIRRSSSL